MTTAVQLKTRELKPGFGAEILDVDLARADQDTLAGVVDTFHRHGAILLRGQDMTPAQLVDFVALFGEPEDHTQKQFTLPGHPKVFVLSNREVDGKPIGAHNDGVGWHTDYSYKAEPVMCTMLYAVEVPAEGSDTLLADGCAAWNALSPERQKALDGLRLHHSYQHFMATREFGRQELSDELKRDNPDVEHPLIRTHPADGRKALVAQRRIHCGNLFRDDLRGRTGVLGIDDDIRNGLSKLLIGQRGVSQYGVHIGCHIRMGGRHHRKGHCERHHRNSDNRCE